MSIDPEDFEDGLQYYWREIARRAPAIQSRERAFPQFAVQFVSRTPPHFLRQDLVAIMEWKHTDARWRDRAITGIQGVTDPFLIVLTSKIGQVDLPRLVREFDGKISGVGVASVSAIVAAARPDLYPVIDDFGLKAIAHYYDCSWVRSVYRDKKSGNFQPTYKDYIPYVEFCREIAAWLTKLTGKSWTPRMVDMALWGIGKKLQGASRPGGGCGALRPSLDRSLPSMTK
jgi:hypothetical protein